MSAEDFQKAIDSVTKQTKKKVPDEEPVVFKEWESSNNLLRVYRGTYRGREQLSIRRFYQEEGSSEWKFGKGVTFEYEDIDLILEALQEMKTWCEEHPHEEKE